jgi:phosphomannomutase
MFGASNLERFELVKSAINHLNTDGIETRMFENPNMMLSELSYTIKNRGYDFGIYINSNNVRTSIRVLGENGRLLKESELEDLNAILETLELDFNLEENKVNKIKVVSDEYRISYESKILSNIE